jgi:hypothetical protein
MVDLELDLNAFSGPLPKEWAQMRQMVKLTMRCAWVEGL